MISWTDAARGLSASLLLSWSRICVCVSVVCARLLLPSPFPLTAAWFSSLWSCSSFSFYVMVGNRELCSVKTGKGKESSDLDSCVPPSHPPLPPSPVLPLPLPLILPPPSLLHSIPIHCMFRVWDVDSALLSSTRVAFHVGVVTALLRTAVGYASAQADR